VKANIFTDLNP